MRRMVSILASIALVVGMAPCVAWAESAEQHAEQPEAAQIETADEGQSAVQPDAADETNQAQSSEDADEAEEGLVEDQVAVEEQDAGSLITRNYLPNGLMYELWWDGPGYEGGYELIVFGDGDMIPMDYPAWDGACSRIKSIVVKEGVTSLGCFSGYPELTKISLPASLRSVSTSDDPSMFESAFAACPKLKSISLAPGNTHFKTDGRGLYFDDWLLVGYAEGTGDTYAVKEGTTTIPSMTFAYCSPMRWISIPSSVSRIDKRVNCYPRDEWNLADNSAIFTTSESVANLITSKGMEGHSLVVIPYNPVGQNSMAADYDPYSSPVYRMYNTITSEHLYTTNWNEYQSLTEHHWVQEGIAWRQESSALRVGVYRLYNPELGAQTKMSHHYTTSVEEAQNLVTNYGWRYDFDGGYAFRCADMQIGSSFSRNGFKVFRLYNPALSAHFYTLNYAEYRNLVMNYGWLDEGVDFDVSVPVL